ncbi:MAG: phosphotransferase family protein, partial [Achromobacter pestifer]
MQDTVMPPTMPSEQIAAAIVQDRLGWSTPDIRRFTTGLAFFVYDVTAGAEQAVVRIGRPEQAGALVDSLALWRRLAPLGVPLPHIIADGTAETLPYVIMARLPGTDLGHVIATLPPARLRAIAHAVADAQTAVARLGPGSGFGYAARAETAPHRCWGDVVAGSIDRSERRIAANGLFDPAIADGVRQRLLHHRATLDAMPPTPFLHDTTTKNVIIT